MMDAGANEIIAAVNSIKLLAITEIICVIAGIVIVLFLPKIYVKKGEKQYMVTAAEILMELNGIDPNGVEKPGIYGDSLVKAAKKYFGGNGTKITASQFLKLIK